MDEQRIAEIRERLSKATPGPWGHFVAEWRPATPVAVHRIGSNETGEDIACVYLTRPSDADLIANAPTDLADLLDERDRLLSDNLLLRTVADAAEIVAQGFDDDGPTVADIAYLDDALADLADRSATTGEAGQ